MSNPLVSIITANYNKATFLEDTLNSVTKQNYTEIEHIIIDDGSTDNSCRILEKYKKNNSFVRLYFNKQNCNCVAKLRNQAVNYSRGKYILNLDSDDVLYSDAISTLVNKAETEKLDICYGSMIYMDEFGSPFKWKKFVGSEYKLGRLIKHMYIPFPRMYKKSIYEKTIGYNENLKIADDWDLYLQMEEKTNLFGWAGERPLFIYRQVKTSLSNSADTISFQNERAKVKNNALKRRKTKRILIIGDQWIPSYINHLRSKGNDICSFFMQGKEDLDLEQYVWGQPFKNKSKYKIPFVSEIKKYLLLKNNPPQEIQIFKSQPLLLLIFTKLFFTFYSIKKIHL